MFSCKFPPAFSSLSHQGPHSTPLLPVLSRGLRNSTWLGGAAMRHPYFPWVLTQWARSHQSMGQLWSKACTEQSQKGRIFSIIFSFFTTKIAQTCGPQNYLISTFISQLLSRWRTNMRRMFTTEESLGTSEYLAGIFSCDCPPQSRSWFSAVVPGKSPRLGGVKEVSSERWRL